MLSESYGASGDGVDAGDGAAQSIGCAAAPRVGGGDSQLARASVVRTAASCVALGSARGCGGLRSRGFDGSPGEVWEFSCYGRQRDGRQCERGFAVVRQVGGHPAADLVVRLLCFGPQDRRRSGAPGAGIGAGKAAATERLAVPCHGIFSVAEDRPPWSSFRRAPPIGPRAGNAWCSFTS